MNTSEIREGLQQDGSIMDMDSLEALMSEHTYMESLLDRGLLDRAGEACLDELRRKLRDIGHLIELRVRHATSGEWGAIQFIYTNS